MILSLGCCAQPSFWMRSSSSYKSHRWNFRVKQLIFLNQHNLYWSCFWYTDNINSQWEILFLFHWTNTSAEVVGLQGSATSGGREDPRQLSSQLSSFNFLVSISALGIDLPPYWRPFWGLAEKLVSSVVLKRIYGPITVTQMIWIGKSVALQRSIKSQVVGNRVNITWSL